MVEKVHGGVPQKSEWLSGDVRFLKIVGVGIGNNAINTTNNTWALSGAGHAVVPNSPAEVVYEALALRGTPVIWSVSASTTIDVAIDYAGGNFAAADITELQTAVSAALAATTFVPAVTPTLTSITEGSFAVA